VNCVGILRERGHETYERVHHLAPAALAAACALAGCGRGRQLAGARYDGGGAHAHTAGKRRGRGTAEGAERLGARRTLDPEELSVP
jgi:hypothetical protein